MKTSRIEFLMIALIVFLLCFTAGTKAGERPLELFERAGKTSAASCVGGLAIEDGNTYRLVVEQWDRGPAFRMRSTLIGRAFPLLPMGACDSQAECERETDNLCSKHGGVDPDSVEITKHVQDDGKTCSADCKQDGAVAFVDCKPRTIIDEPDPAS